MSWEVAIFGTLKFGEGGIDAWRTLPVDVHAFEDWDVIYDADELRQRTFDSSTAGELFDRLADRRNSRDLDLFIAAVQDRELTVRGLMHRDTFIDEVFPLVTAARLASAAGGFGKLYFVGVTGGPTFTLTVTRSKSSLAQGVKGDVDVDGVLAEILDATRKLFTEPFGPPETAPHNDVD